MFESIIMDAPADATDGNEVPQEPPPFQGSDKDKESSRKRKALFLRQALVIADRFSRNPVTFEMVVGATCWLEREQFDEIAIERNAYKNCGYVLCPKPLINVTKQKYVIKSATRQVFDASTRKPFCSDWCFSAAQHLLEQISTEPAWCREFVTSHISLLSPTVRAKPGKLILDGLRSLRLSNKRDSESDGDTGSDLSDNADRCVDEDDDSQDEINKPVPKRSISQPHNSINEQYWGVSVTCPKKNLVVERCQPLVPESRVIQTGIPEEDGVPIQSEDIFTTVRQRLLQWLTPKAFWLLQQDVPCTTDTQEENPISTDLHGEKEYIMPGVLPILDAVSKSTLQRQIIWESLVPSLSAILTRRQIPSRHILSRLNEAIAHFKLTNMNIHMAQMERGVVALTLLRLMAPMEESLKQLLDDEKLSKNLQIVSDESCKEFLERVILPICDHFAC